MIAGNRLASSMRIHLAKPNKTSHGPHAVIPLRELAMRPGERVVATRGKQ